MDTSVRDMSKRRRGKLARKEAVLGVILASPWILGFLLFTVGPVIASLYYSFTRYPILSTPVWIGLQNYTDMLTKDPQFWTSLYNTAYYAIFSIPLIMIFGLLLSLLMNTKLGGINIFRTVYYLPAVVSGVAITVLWLWIFNPVYGLINQALSLVGIEGPAWLQEPQWSKPAIILMNLWTCGGVMVIYLAGLQGIPQDLYDAADIDGARTWAKFWNVTFPMLSPIIFFNLITTIIGSFAIFSQALIMTNGGPLDSTLFYYLYLYNTSFRDFKMGYGSAMAWVLLIIVLAFTLFQFRMARRWVYYESVLKQ